MTGHFVLRFVSGSPFKLAVSNRGSARNTHEDTSSSDLLFDGLRRCRRIQLRSVSCNVCLRLFRIPRLGVGDLTDGGCARRWPSPRSSKTGTSSFFSRLRDLWRGCSGSVRLGDLILSDSQVELPLLRLGS